uniref:Aspartoacylase n=1 Tax=Chromera velia CCMP2878 TaxID=1169474 RepID=A0A0G4G0W7_9ALVE|eukprot:Cvel_19680.t1-p1 / transcript=Cvel_19680.t1 / gene=Cvel_19680 / organism=Chromera_velia_CCMP2878 / gene_product=Probable aspartoacylase, putative / transcript_product=Probable aspartoacylase, putative / location=Cvel_scaffold1716:14276-15697(+) / protein_length=445 / sequence_SO=supercontig / SO=protein_coding / is_pseudo=false
METSDWSPRHVTSREAVKTCVIAGATHGNELNGLHLVKYMLRTSTTQLHRKTLEVKAIISNPEAANENRRYVEEDLNRCFVTSRLAETAAILDEEEAVTNGDAKRGEHKRVSLEMRRAVELDAELGPKHSPSPNTDFLIDLHGTVSNTGTLLLMAEGDGLALEVAAYLCSLDPSVRVSFWPSGGDENPFLPTVARSGMTFEVGPCPHGSVRAGQFLTTRNLITEALDYLDRRNQRLSQATSEAETETVESHTVTAISTGVVSVSAEGEKTALGKRAQPAPSSRLVKASLTIYSRVGFVDFPRDAMGDLRGTVHADLDGRDFAEIGEGALAFEIFDGTARHFHRARDLRLLPGASVEPEEPLFAFFINEPAYYEKGVAFVVARRGEVEVTFEARKDWVAPGVSAEMGEGSLRGNGESLGSNGGLLGGTEEEEGGGPPPPLKILKVL